MKNLEIATNILQKLESHGYITYFAGGCVRDLLMGKSPDDIDIATEAPIQEIQRIFPKTHAVGAQFNILIVVEEGQAFEVAQFRKDGLYQDGRKPESVERASPEEDAHRRDFTINGLFYHPLKKEIIDYVNGEKDLRASILRTIGSAEERFEEDRLRMLRACRFSACLNFPIEKETQLAIEDLAPSLFPSVSIERVWQEFNKAHKCSKLSDMLLLMLQTPLFDTVFNSLNLNAKKIEKRLKTLNNYNSKLPIGAFFTLILDNCSRESLVTFFEYFKASKKDFKSAYHYACFKIQLTDYLTKKQSSLYPLMMACTELEMEVLFAIYSIEHENLPQKQLKELSVYLRPHVEAVKNNTPWVSAQNLTEANISPGPQMGKLLQEAKQIAVDNNLTDKGSIIKELKLSSSWPR
ncbi:MAG: hypothetical protein GWP59_05575 [Chlamydiales bacterium]|nr:hypothetical protein [Chlamydiales bacterium]